MDRTISIAIGILIAFSFTFAIFFFAMDHLSRPPGGYIRPTEFYSQSFDSATEKIFILGSSHAGVINATYINEYLSERDFDYWHIYNLAKSADRPAIRVSELDRIISTNPSIVLYVVGMRDFERSDDSNKLKDIPNPIELAREVVNPTSFIDYDFNEIRNPKLITLRTISELTKGNSTIEDLYHVDSPFYPIKSEGFARISDDSLLRKQGEERAEAFRGIDPESAEPLKKIIRSLKEENIKIILVASPYNEWYLNYISDDDKHAFIKLTRDVSEEFDVPLYISLDKYATLDIWRDIHHVSTDKSALIFTEDIGNTILSEIS